MKQENVQAAIQALDAYAEAARGYCYGLDGKIVQLDMWAIADVLESDSTTYTAEDLISRLGITKTDNGYEWK